MNRIAASTVRAVRSGAAAVRPASRQMSHGHDAAQAEADMKTWINVSIVGAGVTVAFGAYQMYKMQGEHHHFDIEKNKFAYMRIRNKAFPWDCPDCGLFDNACWDACKGRASSH